MGGGDKIRFSGEGPRLEKLEPSLPKANQDLEDFELSAPAFHPAVYVV